jgi:formamidopyrimidine-DNA glycosylase
VPELPEVETIRSGLEPALVRRRLEEVLVLDARLTRPVPPDVVEAMLTGERVATVGRRGKYLVVGFESGRHLLVHLRMTGSLRHGEGLSAESDPHRRAVVRLDDGSDVVYRDVRRFGTWVVLDEDEVGPYLAERIGPEPLERAFTRAALASALAGRRAPIKSVLLAQKAAAGIGNISADEALWRARVNPLTPAGDLTPEEVAAVHRGLRAALRAGIDRQGASIRDYRNSSGDRGSMQEEFRVYGRDGLPCPRCGSAIVKTRVAGRGTWYCPVCQPGRATGVGSAGRATTSGAQTGRAARTGPESPRPARGRLTTAPETVRRR